MIYTNLSIKVQNVSIKPAIAIQKYSAWMTNIHMCNAKSKIIIVARTKLEHMGLKFGKTIRTLRLSQKYSGSYKKSVMHIKKYYIIYIYEVA